MYVKTSYTVCKMFGNSLFAIICHSIGPLTSYTFTWSTNLRSYNTKKHEDFEINLAHYVYFCILLF